MSGEQRTHDATTSETAPDKTIVLLGAQSPDCRSSSDLATPLDESDFETQEAMRNFQSYLDILQEWDEKEKRNEERRQTKAVRCD